MPIPGQRRGHFGRARGSTIVILVLGLLQACTVPSKGAARDTILGGKLQAHAGEGTTRLARALNGLQDPKSEALQRVRFAGHDGPARAGAQGVAGVDGRWSICPCDRAAAQNH